MKKRLQIICLIITICMALTSFVGCDGSQGESASNDSITEDTREEQPTNTNTEEQSQDIQESDEEIELMVWGGVPAEKGPQDLIDDFMSKNPNIKIEYFRYVNNDQGNLKLDTALMSGEAIDVYITAAVEHLVRRVEAGVAEDLGPWLEKDNFDMKENYGENYLQVDGNVYSIPTGYEKTMIYINKDMFDAAGIEIPESWTIDEYREITKKLTKTIDGKTIYGGFFDMDNICRRVLQIPTLGPNALYDADGSSAFENPIFKDSLNLFLGLMIEDKSHLSALEIQTAKLTPYSEFLNGNTATAAAGIWITRYIRDTENFPHAFKTAVAPFPSVKEDEVNYDWPGSGNYILMNKQSKHKEAAYQFMKYWATEGSVFMTKGGKNPAWKNVDEDQVLNGLLGESKEELFDVESFRNVLFNSEGIDFVDTETTALPEINNIWKEIVERVIGGDLGVDDAIQEAVERADKAIQDASN